MPIHLIWHYNQTQSQEKVQYYCVLTETFEVSSTFLLKFLYVYSIINHLKAFCGTQNILIVIKMTSYLELMNWFNTKKSCSTLLFDLGSMETIPDLFTLRVSLLFRNWNWNFMIVHAQLSFNQFTYYCWLSTNRPCSCWTSWG